MEIYKQKCKKDLLANNKGETTVFLCLVVSVLLTLVLCSLEFIRIQTAKSKVDEASSGAIYDAMADYYAPLFDRYHLVFLDKTYGGKGEATMEYNIGQYMDYTLGNNHLISPISGFHQFDSCQVAVTNEDTILDSNMLALKEQIVEWEKYQVVNHVVDIFNSDSKESQSETGTETSGEETGDEETGGDETDGEINSNTDLATKNESANSSLSDRDKSTNANFLDGIDLSSISDTSKLSGALSFKSLIEQCIPKDMEVEREVIDLSTCPSKGEHEDTKIYNFNISDDDKTYKNSKPYSKSTYDSTISSLDISYAAAIDYIVSNFSNATNYNTDFSNYDKVFNFEIEYLLVGKDNDYDNLETVIKRIMVMRYATNIYYLGTSKDRMREAEALAKILSVLLKSPQLAKTLKYVVVALWAYGESVHDMQELLEGSKVPLIKNDSNMYYSLDNLGQVLVDSCKIQGSNDTLSIEDGSTNVKQESNIDELNSTKRVNTSDSDDTGDDSDEGFKISYETYLVIFLALESQKDSIYVKMLDLIELNLKVEDERFEAENLIYGMEVDIETKLKPLYMYKGTDSMYDINVHKKFVY